MYRWLSPAKNRGWTSKKAPRGRSGVHSRYFDARGPSSRALVRRCAQRAQIKGAAPLNKTSSDVRRRLCICASKYGKAGSRGGCAQRAQIKGAAPPHYRVDDGTRTHDTRNHNPMLYQLNYIHRVNNPSFRNGLQIYKLILICKSKVAGQGFRQLHCCNILYSCQSKTGFFDRVINPALSPQEKRSYSRKNPNQWIFYALSEEPTQFPLQAGYQQTVPKTVSSSEVPVCRGNLGRIFPRNDHFDSNRGKNSRKSPRKEGQRLRKNLIKYLDAKACV